MPAASSGTPSQVISNIPSGWPVFAATNPLTTTLVLVPMSVQRPPRTTASFIGISSFETLRRCFFAQSRIAGTIRATTGVLFINAETTAGPSMVRSWAEASDFGRPSARSTTAASAPVRSMAAATTKSAATVSIPSLAIPWKVSAGVSTPAASSSTAAPIITMSGARCPTSRLNTVPRTTAAVSSACQFDASQRVSIGAFLRVREKRDGCGAGRGSAGIAYLRQARRVRGILETVPAAIPTVNQPHGMVFSQSTFHSFNPPPCAVPRSPR